MKKITSFTIDHLRLLRGVYLSRQDHMPEGGVLSTFDVRMKQPNAEPVMAQDAMHTLEHLAATYLRNHKEWGHRIVYWGPMGCLTGCYLIVQGAPTAADMVPLLKDTFSYIAQFEGEIPGATQRDCGNAALHNLAQARVEAKRYLEEVLMQITPEQLTYPK